jgi:hypothetical protein
MIMYFKDPEKTEEAMRRRLVPLRGHRRVG